MKQCPQCGAQTEGAARFCKNCAFDFSKAPAPQPGADMAATIKMNQCPNCGSAVAAGARFCKNCASPIAGAGASPQYDQPAYPQPGYAMPSRGGPNRRTLIIAAVAGGVILLTGIILLIVLLPGGGGASTPGQAVKSLISAQLQGDTNGFISYFTKQDRDAINAAGPERKKIIEDVVKQTASQAKTRGMPDVNIKKENINGDFATVDFEVKWKDGETEQTQFRLVKEDGNWRVRASDIK
jgi:rRNA maturation protein Nop10